MWVDTEQLACLKVPLEPPLQNNCQKTLQIQINRIKQLIKICLTMQTKLNVSNSVSRATMAKNPDFFFFFFWPKFEGSNLKWFEQLQQEFNLPKTDFYKHLPLRLQNHSEWSTLQGSIELGGMFQRYMSQIDNTNINPVLTSLVLKENERKCDKNSWWLGGVQVWITINFQSNLDCTYVLANSPALDIKGNL